MRRHRFRPQREAPEEHATALPLLEEEQEATFCVDGGGGTRKRVLRPDGDGFTVLPDGDEDPPIAAVFDSYREDD